MYPVGLAGNALDLQFFCLVARSTVSKMGEGGGIGRRTGFRFQRRKV